MENLAKTAYSAVKGVLRELCPPLLWQSVRRVKLALVPATRRFEGHPGHQDLEVYWDDEMAQILETWGEGNVWNEIQLLLYDRSGRVLDIACGTGKTMSVLARFPALEIHGFDISDFLVGKARERGIPPERLRVADATRLDYPNASFDYSYSIGSFEHFTEEGLVRAIAESARVTVRAAFHMVPVSRSGTDEGWMKTYQSFFNNSIEWWVAKYQASFPEVMVLESAWNDGHSLGRWFVCTKKCD
jgi:SAM-dependent methyltransferase